MSTTQAAILVAQRQPLAVDEVELPSQLEVGQALVEVAYSSICGSQLGEIDGVKGEDRYLPHLLGHEGSGRVLEVGPGVKRVKPGDHVVLHWMNGSGIQSETPKYHWRDGLLNAGWVTTFNAHAVVSENRVTAIPRDFDLGLATLLGCAVTTGLGVITNNARLQIGEAIVVFGAGGVGLNVVQGAELVSAYPIVAVDVVNRRLDAARRFGASHTINSREVDVRSELQHVLEGTGPDVIVETTGRTDMIQLAYELTAPQGRTILVGVPRAGEDITIHSLPLHFGKVLTGSHGGETNPDLDIPRYVRLHQAGKLRLEELIDGHYRLSQINEAIANMRSGNSSGRCLIEICP